MVFERNLSVQTGVRGIDAGSGLRPATPIKSGSQKMLAGTAVRSGTGVGVSAPHHATLMSSARYSASLPTPENRPDLNVCIQCRPRK